MLIPASVSVTAVASAASKKASRSVALAAVKQVSDIDAITCASPPRDSSMLAEAGVAYTPPAIITAAAPPSSIFLSMIYPFIVNK